MTRVKLADAEPFTRRIFEGLARPVLEATTSSPRRARQISPGIADPKTTRWVLDGLASVDLVERHGTDWWIRTGWGDQAIAGEAPPAGWPS